MSYTSLQVLSASIAAVLFGAVIVATTAYLLWPGNSEKFKRAASQPLNQDTLENGS